MKVHLLSRKTWIAFAIACSWLLPAIGMAQEVASDGYKITKTWARAVPDGTGHLFAIHYEGVAGEDFFGDIQLMGAEIFNPKTNEWQTYTEQPPVEVASTGLRAAETTDNLFHGSFHTTHTGEYRLKLLVDDQNKGTETEIYTKEVFVEAVSTDPTALWKDKVFDALSITSNGTLPTVITMDGVSATRVEGGRCAVAIPYGSDVELKLTGGNSYLDSMVVEGKLLLTHDGETQFTEDTKIYNLGTFVDSTATLQKVYGPAGIWVESEEVLDMGGISIRSISHYTLYYPFNRSSEASLEFYENGEWVNVNSSKDDPEIPIPASLRATASGKPWHSNETFNLPIPKKAGTYRIKYHVTASEGATETILYSKPYILTDIDEITDEKLTIGKEGETTSLGFLYISAKGTEGVPAEASLTNVSFPVNEVGAPSVIVKKDANVNLTLKGTNDLGVVEVSEGASITLKPEKADLSENGALKIAAVRNGGKFVDETGTVACVKDLMNQTMIELADTIVAQIGDLMSVSVRAICNSLEGDYAIEFEGPQKWDAATSSWVDHENPVGPDKQPAGEKLLRATSTDESGETVMYIVSSEEGRYRMKLTSSSFVDGVDREAVLFFVFELKKMEATVISETQEEPLTGEHEMLIFKSADGGEKALIEATLNGVQVKEHEIYASTVVMENEKVALTLNGSNVLGEFQVLQGSEVVLKKGDAFTSLSARVENDGSFADETGTVDAVEDSKGYTMLRISDFGCIEALKQWYVKVTFNSWEGYDLAENVTVEKWNGTAWVQQGSELTPDGEKPALRATPTDDLEESGEEFTATTVTEPGEYRFKIVSSSWLEEDAEHKHTATLYRYFTIAAPTPAPTYYYDVTIPEVTGVTTSPAAGTYSQEEGTWFRFTLTLDPDYDQSVPVVKAGEVVLTPDAEGTYTIEGVYEDITISISGIEPNEPTANAEVEGDEVKVWATEGVLHIQAPMKSALRIYTPQGVAVHAEETIVGERTVSLNKGIYIVLIGERRFKIAM